MEPVAVQQGTSLKVKEYSSRCISLFKNMYLFRCIRILPGRMCVCHVCVWCPQRSEEGSRFPGTQVDTVVSPHVVTGNWTWDFYKKRHMPLTAKPSHQSCVSLFYGEDKHNLNWENVQGDWSRTLLKRHRLEEKPLDSICEILACAFLMLASGKPLFLMLGAYSPPPRFCDNLMKWLLSWSPLS